MAKIRSIIGPAKKSKNVTVAEARAALRELRLESRSRSKKLKPAKHVR